jgi:hypothetical protein
MPCIIIPYNINFVDIVYSSASRRILCKKFIITGVKATAKLLTAAAHRMPKCLFGHKYGL